MASRRVYKDLRGNVVEPGVRVAYNYSGQVASGEVINVTPGGEIHIERDPGVGYQGTNSISKVKRSESTLVIFETDYQGSIDAAVAAASLEASKEKEKYEKKFDEVEFALRKFIDRVRNAWDLDEVKIYLEELYGKDILEEKEEVPAWLQETQ